MAALRCARGFRIKVPPYLFCLVSYRPLALGLPKILQTDAVAALCIAFHRLGAADIATTALCTTAIAASLLRSLNSNNTQQHATLQAPRTQII